MKILITGGFGFIGAYLAEALLKRGYEVRILDVKSGSLFANKQSNGLLEVVNGEIRNFNTCLNACRGIDVVFHLAAIASIRESFRNPKDTFEINVTGTENLLKASRDCSVKLFVFASSGKVYGNAQRLPSKETDTPIPTTPYAVTKYECEKLCRDYSQKFLMNIISLRYFSIYGPRMPLSQGLIGDIFRCAHQGGHLILGGTEKMERDFTYINDAVEANLLCLNHPCLGYEVFNIGSGKASNVGDLIRLIQKHFDQNLTVQYQSPPEGTIFRTQADLANATQRLLYSPKTNLEEGLAKTFEWLKSEVYGNEVRK